MHLLGQRLKELRQNNKVTQKELADFLQITVSTCQRYEYNTLEPDINKIIKLADFFNVTTDYLLGRTDKPN